MDGLTAVGLVAVTLMVLCYALEARSRWYILGFAFACVLGSIYGFLQGAWPFGVVEAIWAVIALRRWAKKSVTEILNEKMIDRPHTVSSQTLSMNPNRKHNRATFYKYMSASTAKEVLRHRKLRWSSPLRFNDPFDVPRELGYGFNYEALYRAVMKEWVKILRNPPINYDQLSPTASRAIRHLASAANQKAVIETLSAQLVDPSPLFNDTNRDDVWDGVKTMWRETLPQLRILCLSTSHTRTSMWHHYAEKYTGVVLEILCSDELGSPWLLAQPVQYPDLPPDLFREEGWARFLTHNLKEGIAEMLRQYTFYKTPDWSYEEEWRLFSFKGEMEEGEYTDYPVHPAHFAKVFFGPNVSEIDRSEIITLLKADLAHVEPFQAQFELDRRFSFHPIAVPK